MFPLVEANPLEAIKTNLFGPQRRQRGARGGGLGLRHDFDR